MELLKKQIIDVVEVTYTLQDSLGVIIYKEWWQDGNVVDSVLRDKNGYEIDDAGLLERIVLYLESINEF